MEHGIWSSLDLCAGLFGLLLYLLGAVLCLVFRRLSPWLLLAMAGFGLEVLVGMVRAVLVHVLAMEFLGYTALQVSHLALNVLDLFAFAMILAGFGLALGEVQRKLARSWQEGQEPRPRIPDVTAAEPFRERKPGSPDIQQ
jgi:hypothetical protein